MNLNEYQQQQTPAGQKRLETAEKMMHLTQRDVALFMLEFNRDIEVISVVPQKRRRIRGEQAE